MRALMPRAVSPDLPDSPESTAGPWMELSADFCISSSTVKSEGFGSPKPKGLSPSLRSAGDKHVALLMAPGAMRNLPYAFHVTLPAVSKRLQLASVAESMNCESTVLPARWKSACMQP